MDYNKLMKELENCLGLETSATESVNQPKPQKEAFEAYDEIEQELADDLGVKVSAEEGAYRYNSDGTITDTVTGQIQGKDGIWRFPSDINKPEKKYTDPNVRDYGYNGDLPYSHMANMDNRFRGESLEEVDESKIGEEDITFDEGEDKTEDDPKEILKEAIKAFYNSLDMEPEEAIKVVNEVMAEALDCGECKTEEGGEDDELDIQSLDEISTADEGCNKEPAEEGCSKKEEAKEEKKEEPVSEEEGSAFEEFSAKMLNRYKNLAANSFSTSSYFSKATFS